MKAFLISLSGRILFAAFAVALVGTGVAKLLGPSALALGAMTTFGAVTLAVLALALAIEDHFGAAAAAIIALPWLLFLGQLGQSLVTNPHAGYGMVAAGLLALSLAVRPAPAVARTPRAVANHVRAS